MRLPLVILWIELTEEELEAMTSVAETHAASVRTVRAEVLSTEVFAEGARGGVVVVARGDMEATQALAAGADEVLRVGRVDTAAVDQALTRALARAEGRIRRLAMDAARSEDVDRAMALLYASLGHELRGPLTVALINCDVVTRAVDALLRAHDARLGPRSVEDEYEGRYGMRDALQEMHDALQRAARATRRLCDLSRPEPTEPGVDAGAVINEFAGVVRAEVEHFAVFEVEAADCGRALVGRPVFLCLLGALTMHALDALRARATTRGTLALRGAYEEDAVVIEVRHDGSSMPPELRPNIIEAYVGGEARSHGVQGVRESARKAGGELLVAEDRSGTTFRLILPAAPREDTLPLDPSSPRNGAGNGRRASN